MKTLLRAVASLPSLVLLGACGGQVVMSPEAGPEAAVVVDAEAPDTVVEDVAVPASGIGNACVGNGGTGQPEQGDCADGQLCLDFAGFTNGYCTQQCSSTRPCPSDAACVPLGGFNICLQRCRVNSDCRVDDFYTCQGTDSGNARVCYPLDGPVGTRDGEACFTTTAGPHQIPALQRRTFPGANLSLTVERSDLSLAAEGNVAVRPDGTASAATYIALGRGGSAFMGTSTVLNGTTVVREGRVADPEPASHPDTTDPVLAYLADGRLLMVFLGYQVSGGGGGGIATRNMRVRVATSANDGRNWAPAIGIEPTTLCRSGCDKPWIATGRLPGGADGGVGGEVVYVGYMVATTTGTARLVVQRSLDGGQTFQAPVEFANTGRQGNSFVVPNLLTPFVDAAGTLHVTWDGLSATSGDVARYGVAANRVLYRASTDGGLTFGPVSIVSRNNTDKPVYNQPVVAAQNGWVHVAYVSGEPFGAWDLILASSNDGGRSWRHRKVNDEPESCATHAFPFIAAHPALGAVHLSWLENRFGDGGVAYSRCPDDPGAACAPNEAISDAPFTFTTSRDPGVWHGDYQALTVSSNGEVMAAWSDTRTARPHMYWARSVPLR